MKLPDFETFEAEALARGFDEVLVRAWAADQQIRLHSHPFDADALVVSGEMWLTVDGETRHLSPGSTFVLPAMTPHEERYGSEGATYWVARRAAAAT
jgi:mannose-6-phosphate isomerase-like protein (cupin superfamily)